jgi:hypothetical protein
LNLIFLSIALIALIHSTSHFVFLNQAEDPNQWLAAFQRSLADFLPVLSLRGDIKVGIIDYVVTIVGGALTFVLLPVALRRKFERKYTGGGLDCDKWL